MPMFKNEYPYTNIHEINLDWIIKTVEEIRAMIDKYIINYEQITFADPIQWQYSVEYPMHTIVLDESYNAYLSKQDVPSYTQLGNADFWMKIGDFFQYIEKALSTIAYNETTRTTASKSYAVGDLLINNDVLYRTTAQINAGTTFEIGVNIEQVTVESLLDDLKSAINTNADNISTNADNISTNADNIAALQTSKQNVLTFDTTPAAGSTNPVTSAGIKTAMDTLITEHVNIIGHYYTAEWMADSSSANNTQLTYEISGMPAGEYLIIGKYPECSATILTSLIGTNLSHRPSNYHNTVSESNFIEMVQITADGGTVKLVTNSSTSITFSYKDRGYMRAIRLQ